MGRLKSAPTYVGAGFSRPNQLSDDFLLPRRSNGVRRTHEAKLSAVPAAEQCGWLKDKYGLSWQITPIAMDDMLRDGTAEQIARVTQAFLPMKKFDLAALRKAYEG